MTSKPVQPGTRAVRGLEWGGDWTGFKHLPHFQYTGSLSPAACRSIFPQGLGVPWERVT